VLGFGALGADVGSAARRQSAGGLVARNRSAG